MSKLLLKVNSNTIYPGYDLGYILGMEKYSICFDKKFSIDDVKHFINDNPCKDVFVALNRVIYNSELEDYKKTLMELDKLGLKGIIVGDIAALTYDLKTNIVLDQLHLNNSYLSINHYYKNNGCGCFLTNDITKDEINEIKENTNAKLLKQVFGYTHLSTSVRKLVTNYLKHFKLDDKSSVNYIKEINSDDYYVIKEDEFGTNILSSKILNLFNEKDEINVDYLVIDSYLLDDGIVNDAVNAFVNNDKVLNDKLCKLIDTNNGFIDKKTIYKVKNYEK